MKPAGGEPWMRVFDLPGGRYARISEGRPNGEYDWRTPRYVFREMPKETGCELDLSRPFFLEQTGYGRSFVLYAPVR